MEIVFNGKKLQQLKKRPIRLLYRMMGVHSWLSDHDRCPLLDSLP